MMTYFSIPRCVQQKSGRLGQAFTASTSPCGVVSHCCAVMSQQSRYWMALAWLGRSKVAQREGLTKPVMHMHRIFSDETRRSLRGHRLGQ